MSSERPPASSNVMFITFAILVGLAICGAVVIVLVNPDAQATFSGFIFQILGMVTIAAGTFASVNRLGRRVERSNSAQTELIQTVKHQTNGALGLRDARVEALKKLARDNGLDVRATLDKADDAYSRRNDPVTHD